MAKVCTSCGETITKDTVFCTACGLPLYEEGGAGDGELVMAGGPAHPQGDEAAEQAYQTSAVTQSIPPIPPKEEPRREEDAAPLVTEPDPAQDAPPKGKYAPISTMGFVGIFLLLGIPFVGLALIILWACGKCKKITKRNLARALLILCAISLVTALILTFVVIPIVKPILAEYFMNLGLSLSL